MKVQFILLFVITLSIQTFGQQIKGRVFNEFNEPLENVYVINTNNNVHTHTDEDGNFALEKVAINHRIQLSILGYAKKEFILQEKNIKNGITIVLETKIFQLE